MKNEPARHTLCAEQLSDCDRRLVWALVGYMANQPAAISVCATLRDAGTATVYRDGTVTKP